MQVLQYRGHLIVWQTVAVGKKKRLTGCGLRVGEVKNTNEEHKWPMTYYSPLFKEEFYGWSLVLPRCRKHCQHIPEHITVYPGLHLAFASLNTLHYPLVDKKWRRKVWRNTMFGFTILRMSQYYSGYLKYKGGEGVHQVKTQLNALFIFEVSKEKTPHILFNF